MAVESTQVSTVSLLTTIRDVATHQLGRPGGTIRLGLPPTIGPYLLPRVIPRIHRSYPDLKLYVREGMPRDLLNGLDQGRLDMLLFPLPVKGADLITTRLFRRY